ncbi:phosphoribosylanthranilate isomerase [Cellulosilyticum sp. I15G10I2]|uniref:phosphoribosylanthranilate isomerase n=1 Tax=Cellulosilyticum sp. I15G10I2 TaxID=1892843 RepID=UPI00085C54C5|nr:phosphoribosylanthranilate isomerase [Cellulosilyticum sp. I15G10I2]
MTKIKICGLSREADICAVNEYLPDYIGFVFAKSKRQLSINQAKPLKKLLNPKIQAVGVFVNEPIESLISFEKEQVIDMVQLHGDEDEEYIRILKTKIKLPIIKAIRVKDKLDIKQAFAADFVLFDKYVKDVYGGAGESFDWRMIEDVRIPYFLAGGIHLDNIQEALKRAPYAIDISSGVETDGVKDREKIFKIMGIIKEHNNKNQ